jgi:lysophospholipase L1-like esterase
MKINEHVKTILCYGDSNTWGAIPGDRHERYPLHIRWPGLLQNILGAGYYVIEEGLSGRTTSIDDPFEDGRNGKTSLMPCLRTHDPIHLVVLLLGTNDLKARFSYTVFDITKGIALLVNMIQQSKLGMKDQSPHVLLVAPPPIDMLSDYAEEFEGGTIKSQDLAEHYRLKAVELGCEFLNAGAVIQSSKKDGIHWESADHKKIARAIANKIINYPDIFDNIS